jgi:uncharacterized protein (DUF1501 family)
MQRRNFIRTAGAAVSIPFLLHGNKLSASSKPWLMNEVEEENDRVLVLIQLNGGNDGLNTLIPMDQYRNLYQARKNIILPENGVLRITDTLGLHPAMTGMQRLFEEGKMGIVQNVGYPNQNRSHFRSMEIWSTGSPAEEFWQTGWLGRYFDEKYPDFPDAYPQERFPDPFAISMGSYVSDTCQGKAINYSLALDNPFSSVQLIEGENEASFDPFFSDELAYIKDTIAQTNIYSEKVVAAAERGVSFAEYPNTQLARQMKNIALLISGGLQTKVYVVTLGGFDTHSGQVDFADNPTGQHANLLRILSDAIATFQKDLSLLGLEERVMGMTYSEFGRQIRSNGSAGTDHGTAAPLFLFGACTNVQITGQNPEIPDEVENQAGVPMQYDFRDVYGSVLMDWFGLSEANVKSLLYPDFVRSPNLPICGRPTATTELFPMKLNCFPNPFIDWTNIQFENPANQWMRLSIFDALGNELEVLCSQKLEQGEHAFRFDGRHLPAGNYYFRLASHGQQTTKRFVKITGN